MRILVPLAASLAMAPVFAQQLVHTRTDQFVDYSADGDPSQPRVSQGRAYFTLYTHEYGTELWVTDGTPQGTHIADDLWPGTDYAFASVLAAANGRALFTGVDDVAWVSDGTPGHTAPLSGVGSGTVPFVLGVLGDRVVYNNHGLLTTDLLPAQRTVLRTGEFVTTTRGVTVNGLMFLRADQGLVVTDGTMAGTRDVRMATGEGVYAVGNVVQYGGRYVFLSPYHSATAIVETDGTTAGTSLRHYLQYGIQPESVLAAVPQGVLLSANGRLYLDSSAQATPLLVRAPATDIHLLTPCPGGALCAARTPATGSELWFTDGTANGTRMLADLAPGTADAEVEDFTPAGNAMFFSVRHLGQHALWRTDFTPAGTHQVMPIGTTTVAPTALDHRVLFAATTPGFGRELWVTDGTPQGTMRLTDGSMRPDLLDPRLLGTVRGQVLYTASDAQHGTQLWHSDGTAIGTGIAVDFGPGGVAGAEMQFRDEVWFYGGNQLWRSNGTAAGTVPLVLRDAGGQPVPLSLRSLQVRDGFGWFWNGSDVYRTDGVTAVRMAALQTGFNPWQLVVTPAYVFVLGEPLTASSATLLAIPQAGGNPIQVDAGLDQYPGVAPLDEQHVLYAKNHELWSTDGVHRENLALPGWLAPSVAPWHGRTILGTGDAVYSTDGTAAGTVRLAQLPSGDLTTTRHGVYFMAQDDHGWELWRTDGTTVGTVRVTDVAPGGRDGVYRLRAIGDMLLLSASDGRSGVEPWVSDGTANGTWQLADLWPGLAGSQPRFFAVGGDHLLFAAQDPTYGQSLFSVPLQQLGAAHVELFASGCGAAAATPTLEVPVLPELGAVAFRFELHDAPVQAPVWFVLGTDPHAVPVGSCTLWVGGAIDTFATTANAAGDARRPLPVPQQPALLGQRLLVQALAIDPSRPTPALSDALLLVVGR